MNTPTDRPRRRADRTLQPRLPDRLRQLVAGRRRGGRLPRNLRRLAAAALTLTAALLLVTPARPTNGLSVVVMTRDLPVGAVLQPTDLAAVARSDPPDGALADPAEASGRTLAGAGMPRRCWSSPSPTTAVGPTCSCPMRPAVDPARPGGARCC